ncbi:acyl-CoA dehydrogenase family protein [Streptomyces plumbiresistens]|uniref:Acyl-CoA dehydrogenase family protein n=1 Tax=Streptomyces plumbiresistens TaxID=511811 RepID=A0ABP7SKA1_9ACTN
MSAVKMPWASSQDGWSDDETWAEFGDVVRAASGTLTHFEETGFGTDFWKEVVGLGWHSAFVAEEFGGLGLDPRAMAEIVAPLAVSGWSHAFLGTAVDAVALLQSVRSRRGDLLLAEVTAGSLRLQPALAESAEAPHPAEVRTRAERRPSGWVINGRKALVPYAEAAGGFVVLAAEAESGDRALFYVPADSAGVTRASQDSLGLPLADVVLEDVAVADDARLASGEAVERALESLLDLEVALDAVALVGIGFQALGLTLQYTSERIVFDKPLDTLQAVQQHCATAFLRLEQARVLARDALVPRTDPVERAWASSIAKVKAGEGIIEVMRIAHRVHGGIGFYDDYPLAAQTRRAVTIQGLHGSVAWHRRRLQDLLLDSTYPLDRTVLSSASPLGGGAR